MPGVVAAFFLVFIPTVGEYVTPLLVGGTSGTLFGNIVQDFFVRAANWPLGSALSMVMLATTLVLSGVKIVGVPESSWIIVGALIAGTFALGAWKLVQRAERRPVPVQAGD